MQVHLAEHLPRNRRIQLGGYYTPEKLVNRVYELIKPYLMAKKENAVVFDSAGGCGAFLINSESYSYRIADYDKEACGVLVNRFRKENVFCTNSLVGVKRERFSIPESSFLIMVGNPPYNDTTSEFRKGEKGENLCDPDLFDRDLGISFLRSYHKLRADLVCVLHPLAYLIKETSFGRLREFKDHYRLKRGDIFSSDIFPGTGLTKFPILIALYERSDVGMTFDYILNFHFNLLERARTFVLANYKTTDRHIQKYPPGKNAPKISPIGLYYYSFRDFNSLKRNASFIAKQIPNSIVVTIENFYKYSYLYALKRLFNPEDSWLYGNLSPLFLGDIERDKRIYVAYALLTHRVLQEMDRSNFKKLLEYYRISHDDLADAKTLEARITSKLNKELRVQEMSGSMEAPTTAANRSAILTERSEKKCKSGECQQQRIQFVDD